MPILAHQKKQHWNFIITPIKYVMLMTLFFLLLLMLKQNFYLAVNWFKLHFQEEDKTIIARNKIHLPEFFDFLQEEQEKNQQAIDKAETEKLLLALRTIINDNELKEKITYNSKDYNDKIEQFIQQKISYNNTVSQTDISDIIDFNALPWKVKKTLPDLNISAHVYSTVPSKRVVKINNHDYQEGDYIQEIVSIKEILPHGIILQYEDIYFKVPPIFNI